MIFLKEDNGLLMLLKAKYFQGKYINVNDDDHYICDDELYPQETPTLRTLRIPKLYQ